jgi:hypothetical protein
MQAALHLSVTGGGQTPEVRICNERAESLCRSLNRPRLLDVTLKAQWLYCLINGKLGAAMQVATRLYSFAQQQNDIGTSIKAHMALGVTHYYLGNFKVAREHAKCGVRIWRLGDVHSQPEDVDAPIIGCLTHKAFCAWHYGEIASCHLDMEEAISIGPMDWAWPYFTQRLSGTLNVIRLTWSDLHRSYLSCQRVRALLIFEHSGLLYWDGRDASPAARLKVSPGSRRG